MEGWGYSPKIVQNLKNKGHSPLELCRIRHQGRLIGCRVEGKKVFLEKAEYGVAPGQVAVIYQTEGLGPFRVFGGGIIS